MMKNHNGRMAQAGRQTETTTTTTAATLNENEKQKICEGCPRISNSRTTDKMSESNHHDQ